MHFYTVQVLRNEEREIVGHKCLLRTTYPAHLPNVESVIVQSNLKIEPDHVSVSTVDGKLVISENTSLKTSEAEIALRMRRIQFGQRLVSIMSIRNEAKNLTSNQIVQLVSDFSAINTAWLNGSISTSRALISAMTPDGVILTNADKTAILAEIDANLVALGYE